MHANRMVTDTLRLLVKNETKIEEKNIRDFPNESTSKTLMG